MMIAMGVNDEGFREMLGVMVGDSESEASWSEFFAWLKSRDLRGLDMVVPDDHGGLVKAVKQHFQGGSWQRCQTHFMRNIWDASPKVLREEIRDDVRAIFDAANADTARLLLKTIQVKVTGEISELSFSFVQDLK